MVLSRSREQAKSAGVVDPVQFNHRENDPDKVEAPIDPREPPQPSPPPTAAAETEADVAPTGPSAMVRATQAPVIEPGTESDDEFDLDSSLPSDDTTASLSSSIYTSFSYERGRRYQSFGDGRYPIPNDDLEQNREDMKHAMLMMLTQGKPFFSPIGTHPQKILDIGTGTGIWAIEVGDRYPSAHVCGIDLTPIQPEWVPANVSFLVDDCTLDWIERDVDLAHFRFMVMILKDIPTVLGHCYDHPRSLRPGGWVELQELHGVPLCDDGTMTDEDPVKTLYDTAGAAYKKFGMSTTLPAELEPYLREAGFENVHCRIMKVPIGTWAKEKLMRAIGLYQKMAILDFIPTLVGRPFQALQISEAEAEVRVALARKGLEDPSTHRYFNYYFWYAQKPASRRGEDEDV
ncbi:Methyltransferase type 11 [Metarhizium album ARSEF 1941]|uniref:Methyltransferase type 11 n=1 Tax=Metarhizium album (strain ARSEF 1941) TaxID=1081103 RepID=A0A0B2WZ56_METAS|nr:Methyltransferase type 11 [Metarhizium album ARSEF 1941]KHO01582.1 Methyltransferase type 11 [Metarhizium album ARSEF 1941]